MPDALVDKPPEIYPMVDYVPTVNLITLIRDGRHAQYQKTNDKEMKMNVGRLVWGIVCLALAGLLAVLNIVLPDEETVFMVGSTDMSYIPPIVLAIVGIMLLSTSGRKAVKADGETQTAAVDEAKVALNKRLETIAWGCFLVMLGGFIFVPHMIVEGGFWSIGVGAIMLGLNGARYHYKIRMSSFTTVLGVLSVAVGTAQLFGMKTFEGAALFIILGIYLILKPLFERRQLFGKAEEG
jgi:hypothetical protein